MTLSAIDWVIIFLFFAFSLLIGIIVSKRAGKSSSDFFLSGRQMPWWLLGVSMVATTFSTDTPNLVTDIVRRDGVSGNWVWWAFLLTGTLTTFVYSKLWRRSQVLTDIEFYEMRYSGKSAAFLRGFRTIYLGVFFNIVIMASVTLAAIKIGGVMLGLTPMQTVTIAAIVTVAYSMLGGLTGVLITDFFQFMIAMFGAIMAAKIALAQPAVGGLSSLLTNPAVTDKLSILPDFSNTKLALTVFIIPLTVQWWSVWYPGSEPGGGGYLVQRMLAAKDEKNAVVATLFFNIAHYALRPWPWIIVALCSLLVYPDLASIKEAFPNVDESIIKNDIAYPAMLTLLPSGLLGMVLASLIAAYMSTISTHLNWGSSYIVNDFYKRFVNPDAPEKRLVLIGRLSTAILMVAACLLAPLLQNAGKAFYILMQIGAGTGLLFILRWFWWRINAFSEIAAMVSSVLVAIYFEIIHPAMGLVEIDPTTKLLVAVAITTVCWVATTFLTQPSDEETLKEFYIKTQPGGPGWKKIRAKIQQSDSGKAVDDSWELPTGILCMLIASIGIYSGLFATGYWIYSNRLPAIILSATCIISMLGLIKLWNKLKINKQ
ncbi:MAG: sodium:solute symporter family protein [Sedimentisphaeraceae bacterium JB056]